MIAEAWIVFSRVSTLPGGWILPLATIVGIVLLFWIVLDTAGTYGSPWLVTRSRRRS